MERNKIYLSHPYTGHEELMRRVAHREKIKLEKWAASDVWSPTENIPPTATWQEAMDICTGRLKQGDITQVIVLNIIKGDRNLTLESKGVRAEMELAMRLGITIVVRTIRL